MFYQLIIDENTSRIGILIESSDDHVIFRILDGLRFTEDVTFTIPDLINKMNGKIIRMKPDHANGIFTYEMSEDKSKQEKERKLACNPSGLKLSSDKERMVIDMEEVITLNQLSNVQNWLAKGVRIAFCLDESAFVTNKIDMINFKQIKEQISSPEKFRVFRIDSSNDLICVYVIEIAD